MIMSNPNAVKYYRNKIIADIDGLLSVAAQAAA
jgi:hypothetical protein